MTKIRTYNELRRLQTFEERYNYLRLKGSVGEKTFGFDRYINQRFYTSTEWRQVRDVVISRDLGRDLGDPDREIVGRVIIHHMNPMTYDDIRHANESILDPNQLICCSHNTHNAIHYGDESLLPKPLIIRRPGDTTLW